MLIETNNGQSTCYNEIETRTALSKKKSDPRSNKGNAEVGTAFPLCVYGERKDDLSLQRQTASHVGNRRFLFDTCSFHAIIVITIFGRDNVC